MVSGLLLQQAHAEREAANFLQDVGGALGVPVVLSVNVRGKGMDQSTQLADILLLPVQTGQNI